MVTIENMQILWKIPSRFNRMITFINNHSEQEHAMNHELQKIYQILYDTEFSKFRYCERMD